MNKIIIQFAKKWKMEEQIVFTIYTMVRDSGVKYGKTSRTLKRFNVKLSPRQLKYFYRQVVFYERYQIEKKGRPKNYRQLSQKYT